MLPCNGCAYRKEIPGDCHIGCAYDWPVGSVVAMITAVPDKCKHWFHFPWNYDPVWGPDECPHRATTVDPAKVREDPPLAEFLALLR